MRHRASTLRAALLSKLLFKKTHTPILLVDRARTFLIVARVQRDTPRTAVCISVYCSWNCAQPVLVAGFFVWNEAPTPTLTRYFPTKRPLFGATAMAIRDDERPVALDDRPAALDNRPVDRTGLDRARDPSTMIPLILGAIIAASLGWWLFSNSSTTDVGPTRTSQPTSQTAPTTTVPKTTP